MIIFCLCAVPLVKVQLAVGNILGKIEPGESGEQCLRRELNEELCIDAEIGEKMAESIFETGSKTIHLHAYRVNRYEGKIQLTVHDQME